MNSICRPMPKVGSMTIKNLKGGEINMEAIVPSKAYHAPIESLSLFSNRDLRELIQNLNEDISELPKRYHVKNGIVTEVKDFDMNILKKRELLEARKKACFTIINRRNRKYPSSKKIISIDSQNQYEITKPSMNRGILKKFVYEMKEGDKMNEIHKGYLDKNGIYHSDIIVKECVVPYTREEKPLQKRDVFFLHKSGRLGVKFKTDKGVTPTTHKRFKLLPDDEDVLELFKNGIKDEAEFFVLLPKGGRRKKEYGSIPMPLSEYHLKGTNIVPLDEIVKKVYIPEIDGKTPIAKETINEYRGSTDGYGPVYQYDELNHIRDFCPDLLSYNYVDYNQKAVVLVGTKERIQYIDNRIQEKNSIKNGYHKFTDERIIPYKGQTSRCKNSRIVSTEDGVQVFGLNLKGTPEEDLKGYLRGFDRIPSVRNNEEVKELLDIAYKTNGTQTQLNIEYDIRSKIKYLKSRSSKELYYLIIGVEEEITIPANKVTFLSILPGYIEEFGEVKYKAGLKNLHSPSKKELALLEVLIGFKSSKEIEENEGKGLTSDIDDLVTIEKKANDSSYKKSKNLFSQQQGVLLRNQNPLRMDGPFQLYKPWKGKALPVSFPRNESLPERNIEFVQRTTKRRIEIPLRTMFIRGFNYSVKGKVVKTENGLVSKEVGIKVESDPLFFSSSLEKEETYKDIKINYPKNKGYPLGFKTQKSYKDIKFEYPQVKGFPTGFKKIYTEDWIMKHMRIPVYENIVPTNVIGFKVLPPKMDSSKQRLTRVEEYKLHNGCIPSERYFDNRNNPGTVWKKVTWEQYLSSKQKSYQFSGKLVFDKEKHEYVRVPLSQPSSFKVIHTIGDGKGNVDYYIIEINGLTLYAKGDLSLLNKKSISFTGTRKPSRITEKFVKEVVNMFLKKDDYVTISGGAEGCDTIVHRTTIGNNRKTIVVLAGGFNGQYISKGQIKHEGVIKNGGLLLSQYHPEYIPDKKDFIERNKIIAGLSEKLVVFQAGNGTKHCAKFGVELGKELLVQTQSGRNIGLVSRRDYPF